MAKRFTRNIRSIENIEKQPKNTNQQNDLLSDDKHVYVRNKDKYENLTNSVKTVNGKAIDENGNVNLEIKDFPWEEIEKARSDIDSSVSDVQSKASEANEDIDDLVKSTEDARDEAVKSMNELDYSDRNLLPGTSNEWETYEWEKTYSWKSVEYPLEELGLEVGDTITLSKILDNTLDDIDLQIWVQIIFKDVNGKMLSYMRTSSIESGQRGYVKGTEEIPEGTRNLYVSKVNKGNNQTAKTAAGKEAKLQRGTLATSWTPAPEDIVLKSELKKIKQAIINLGGSI